MKSFAYFKIYENMTPREAAVSIGMAKEAGYGDILLLHQDGADISKANYKEKLLSLFRAAFRHKAAIYVYDDSCKNSGTGFGQVASVKDACQRVIDIKDCLDPEEGCNVLDEKGGKRIIAVFPEDGQHYPDLTKPECAEMVIDCVYNRILKDYSKFAGYEIKGFVCSKPKFLRDDGAICYSEAACDKFLQKYGRSPDFFEVLKKGDEFDKYIGVMRECMEEGFILPLKEYCEKKSLDFIVEGGECSVRSEFCKKNNIGYMGGETGACQMNVDSPQKAQEAFIEHKHIAVKIMPGMEKINKLEKFFEKNSDCVISEINNITSLEKDGFIIVNNNTRPVSVCLVPQGDWIVVDWENDTEYELDKKAVYTFYPESFICIKRKKVDMFTDSLPVRVGGVVTKELKEEKALRFCKNGSKVTFTLPESNLSGKCIEFESDCSYLTVRMGYNTQSFILKPYILPLYDFLCGSTCECEVYGGDIYNIKISACL